MQILIIFPREKSTDFIKKVKQLKITQITRGKKKVGLFVESVDFSKQETHILLFLQSLPACYLRSIKYILIPFKSLVLNKLVSCFFIYKALYGTIPKT